MNIRLNALNIESFKGIKSFETDFDTKTTIIKAENGIGKTTVYDAFLWVLFGKDSTGRKDFEVTPLDSANQPIKGVVTMVQTNLNFNDDIHILRKEQHEKVVKGQTRGYETLCFIDEVPKKVSEFTVYIANIIPEDTFKVLTNLRHFSEGIHWKERREILLNIAGEIGTPEGFDNLLDQLNGRSVDDYKVVLKGQKERYEDERDEINPRIDEIQKGLAAYAGDTNKTALSKRRGQVQCDLVIISDNRTALLDQEKNRQRKIDKLNDLKGKKILRENHLKSDTSSVSDLLKEKAKIETFVSEKKQAITSIFDAITLQKTKIEGKQNAIDEQTSTIVSIQQEYKKASKTTDETVCFNCKQPLPENQIKQQTERRQTRLADIAKRGEVALGRVKTLKVEKDELETGLGALQNNLTDAQANLENAEECKRVRFAQIDKEIKANVTPAPDTDETWRKICSDIDALENQIGEPVSNQLDVLEADRTAKTSELVEINNALAQSDRAI